MRRLSEAGGFRRMKGEKREKGECGNGEKGNGRTRFSIDHFPFLICHLVSGPRVPLLLIRGSFWVTPKGQSTKTHEVAQNPE